MKLLLTTDGSQDALDAARFLKRLPLAGTSDVTILNVARSGDTKFAQASREKGVTALEREQKELADSDRRLASVQSTGHASAEIIRNAEELGAELLVTGSRGLGGVKRLLLGSTSDQVARHAPCSVLVVRTPSDAPPQEEGLRVLLAYDGSETADAAVGFVSDLRTNSAISVKVVTVLELVEIYGMEYVETSSPSWAAEKKAAAESLARVRERLSADGNDVSTELLEAANASEAILKAASDFGADLTIVGDKGVSAVDRIVLGSVTAKILHHAPSSVLIVRQRGSTPSQ